MAISVGSELNRKDPGKIVELVVNLDGLEMSQRNHGSCSLLV